MIVAIICIFTVSAFAVEIVSKTESEEYGTVIQLNSDPGLDNASQYISTLKKINNASTDTEALCILTDGTYYYVFPTSYINIERADGILDLYTGTEENPGLAQAMAEFNDAMGTSYYENYAVVGSGTERRIEETVRFTFPSDVTEIRDNICCIRYYPKLVELRFTQAINLTSGGDTFKGCSKLETVVGFEKMDPTLFLRSIFTGCTSLQSIKLPTSIIRIPSSMFAGCGKLRIENLDECTQLTTIGSSAFQDAKTLVFTLSGSVTSIANTFTGGKPTNAVYIYTGTSSSVFSGCDKLSGATVINASDYNPNNSYTGINLVVGYSN